MGGYSSIFKGSVNYDEEKVNKRINIIGQNGNTGLHYQDTEDIPWGELNRVDDGEED